MLVLSLTLPFLACTPPDVDEPKTKSDHAADSGTTHDSDPTDTEETGDSDSGTPPPTITGEASVVLGTANPHLAVVTVTLDHDASVWVEVGEALPSNDVTPTQSVVAGVPTDILVLGLKAGLDYAMVVHAAQDGGAWDSAPMTVSTAPLAAGFQHCSATNFEDRHAPDEVYCTNGTTSSGRTYFCVDHSGDVVYEVAGAASQMMLSMWPLEAGGWVGVSTSTPLLVFFNDRGEVVAQYTSSFFSGKTRWEHQWIDNHEVIEITDGPWAGAVAFITDSYEYVPGHDYTLAQGLIVFDPVSQEVLWDWSAFGDLSDGVPEDPMLDYEHSGPGGFNADFGHGNSLVHGYDDSGREVFWMSLRGQDYLIKIDIASDAIQWRFGLGGDFTLVDDIDSANPVTQPAEDWMFGQHAIDWVEQDGARTTFTIFDNGYYRELDDGSWASAYSRMVEYRLDEDTMLAEQVFTYGPRSSADPEYVYAWGMGDAQVLPDGKRAAWVSGYGTGVGYAGPFIREFGYPDRTLLWSLDCSDYGDGFYRFNWFPSLYDLHGNTGP